MIYGIIKKSSMMDISRNLKKTHNDWHGKHNSLSFGVTQVGGAVGVGMTSKPEDL